MSEDSGDSLNWRQMQAEKLTQEGIELLKEQKPREAIKRLMKALELNPQLKEARTAFEEAMESLKWNTAYFCKNCGKLLLPRSEYPMFQIDEFCPRCGRPASVIKEEIIAFAELALKFLLFGIFPIAVLLFCGVTRTPVYEGIRSALTFTPVVLALLFLYDDPNAKSIQEFNYYTFASLPSPIDFTMALLFLFFLVYLYCLFMFTPIVTIHKIGLWKKREHQRKILAISLAYTGVVGLIRVACGAIY